MAKTKAEKKKKISLTFETDPNTNVVVAGSFNDWTVDSKDKKAKKLKEDKTKAGVYKVTMFLPVGEHEYKFYSENQWFADPKAETNKLNRFGTFNSVLTVA